MQKEFSHQKLLERGKSGSSKILQIMNKEGWNRIDDKPCEMFTMDLDGKLATKGVAEIKYSAQQIYAFLQKPDTFKRLNDNCKQFKTIKKVPIAGTQFAMDINYLRYEGKWPVSDRDFVAVAYTQRNVKGDFIYPSSDASQIYEVNAVKGVVRGEIIVGGYVIEKLQENLSKVTYLSCTDLKGSIPQFLINLVTKKQGSVAGILRDTLVKQTK